MGSGWVKAVLEKTTFVGVFSWNCQLAAKADGNDVQRGGEKG
jgi:hypothetical protein